MVSNYRVRQLWGYSLLAILCISTIGGRYLATYVDMDAKIYEQNYKPILDAINKENKNGTILAPDNLEGILFPISTKHDLFWNSTFASYTNTSFDRYKDALFVYTYLDIDSRKDFAKYYKRILESDTEISDKKAPYLFIEGYLSGVDYVTFDKKRNSDKDLAANSKRVISELDKEYQNFLHNQLSYYLVKYNIKYLIWDRNKNPKWDLSVIKNLRLRLRNNGIFLYEVL